MKAKTKEPAKDVLAAIREADAARAAPKKELELYGREIFRTEPGGFEASEGLAPPDSYVVGPGDRFQLSLWGRLGADFWVAEAYPFLSSFATPHFALGLALLVWIFLGANRSINSSP